MDKTVTYSAQHAAIQQAAMTQPRLGSIWPFHWIACESPTRWPPLQTEWRLFQVSAKDAPVLGLPAICLQSITIPEQ
jgi:hypothetical protein